jgi:YebC/PmpR family DNA-binding regulatory protein
MSGHSHWAGIKHQKEITDKKRGKVFSKLLAAISAAAKTEPNPDFNPRLRTAVEKAKSEKVSQDSILRAISKARDAGAAEEALFEAYGPEGAAILVSVITDNVNRSVQEIKKILTDHGAKWAEPKSVRWAFEESADKSSWTAKFPQEISPEAKEKLRELIEELEQNESVQKVFTNT